MIDPGSCAVAAEQKSAVAKLMEGLRKEYDSFFQPLLPETVVNQIELWVKEKQRVQYAKARLYQHFSSQAEFLEAEAYANDNKVLIWSKHAPEGMRCLLAVRADAHDAMKRFLKARTQHG